MFIFKKCSDLKNVQITKCSFSKNILTQKMFIFEKCSNSNNQEKRNRKKGNNKLKKKVPNLFQFKTCSIFKFVQILNNSFYKISRCEKISKNNLTYLKNKEETEKSEKEKINYLSVLLGRGPISLHEARPRVRQPAAAASVGV
jgi:hypothetical protein